MFGLLMVVLTLGFQKAQSQPPYQHVLRNYQHFLLAQDATSADSILHWTNTLQANGTWTSIDYQDQNSSSWKTTAHLDRVVKISIAYQKRGNPAFHNQKVWNVILKATHHWFLAKYKNPNWWYNEIGVPQFWRDILTLNADLFDETDRNGALEILAQYKLKPNFTGANLTWSADLALHYGLLTKNDSLIEKGSQLLANEIKISQNEGIRADYSYHQHGARLQTHHYGGAFLKENIRLAYELQNSPWAFPSQKVDILKDFLIQGWQWMARGVTVGPATVDRAVSRPGFLQQDISALLPYLIRMYPKDQAKDLMAMLQTQQTGVQTLKGFRYFPFSDFGAYQAPQFSFLLKTISTRTEVAEKINGENQKGDFLNLGNTYFISNGKEYTDLMPFWDWNKLPGVTNFKNAKTIAKSSFVGGLSNGLHGLSVMDFETSNQNAKLSGTKFWAVHNGRVFCLIAGLSATGTPDSTSTTLEQSRLQGKVYLNSTAQTVKHNVSNLANVKWINHHGFTYIPLTPATIDLNVQAVRGSWSSLSKSGSPLVAAEKVFKLSINHKNNQATAYLVDGVTPINQLPKLLAKPDWLIVSNNDTCQAIIFNDGVTMASFHQKGELKVGKQVIEVDRACLLIEDGKRIYASDPLHKGGTVTVTLNNKRISIHLPANGTTVNQNIE